MLIFEFRCRHQALQCIKQHMCSSYFPRHPIELVLGPSVTAGVVGGCMNHKDTLDRQTHTRGDNPQEFPWTRIAWKVSNTEPGSR